MRGGRTALLIVALAAGTLACTSMPTPIAAPTATRTATPTPTLTPQPSPKPSPEPTVLPFPDESRHQLTPGLYDSSPPFAVDFTFVIPDETWSSAHVHDEFFDVMRLDGPQPNIPTRWVAWGFPETVHGPDGAQPVGDLSPAEAIDLMSNVPDVEASVASPFSFAGLDGVHVDLRTDTPGTQIFGGEGGDLALDPGFDVRLGAVGYEEGLLMVICSGPSGELAVACADSQPIIDSVQLH